MGEICDEALVQAGNELGRTLRQRGLSITTVESCTGGWIAKTLTDTGGSSDYFHCGLVTYSNAAKQELAGVTEMSLEKHGAVSEAVVREMVLGSVNLLDTDVAVAVSGVAGPDGGTEEKPVGMVWFAWGTRNGDTEVVCEHFNGGRESIRRQAVLYALQGVHGFLLGNG